VFAGSDPFDRGVRPVSFGSGDVPSTLGAIRAFPSSSPFGAWFALGLPLPKKEASPGETPASFSLFSGDLAPPVPLSLEASFSFPDARIPLHWRPSASRHPSGWAPVAPRFQPRHKTRFAGQF